jgi:hypothetical protein
MTYRRKISTAADGAGKGYVFGAGQFQVNVLTSALDEANASPKGWAPLDDVEVVSRVLWEIDNASRTRRPVAVIGHRRRTPGVGLVLEIADELQDRREGKLYRLEDLVTADEMAAMLRVSADAVWQWQHRRETTGLPEPLIRRPMVWDRREIMDWTNATGRVIHNRRTGSARNGVRPKAVKDVRRASPRRA